MFERMLTMLRPSHRHAHERTSLQENASDSNDSANNIGSSEIVIDGNIAAFSNQQQSDPSIASGNDQFVGEGGARVDGAEDILNGNNEASSSASENQDEHASSAGDGVDEEEEGNIIDFRPDLTTHPFLASQAPQCSQFMRCCLILLAIEAAVKHNAMFIFGFLGSVWWINRWFYRRVAEGGYAASLEAENGDGEADVHAGGRRDAASSFDPDLGLMSFHHQMALAILESQRQMMENGGYGGNSEASVGTGGVTNEAKASWKSYAWGSGAEGKEGARSSSPAAAQESTSGGCGNVPPDEGLGETSHSQTPLVPPGGDVVVADEPACSICLGEYEPGERVLRLPCDHVFHAACLESWTDAHARCPLCNCDLMAGHAPAPAPAPRRLEHLEERMAFRSLALSTLGGRRARLGRSSRRAATRRATRAAAMAAAAAEESLV